MHTAADPPNPPRLGKPTSRRRRSRARRGEGGRLRVEILDAAESLLLQAGSEEAVSLRAVADAVGVTTPSIYRHFADKQTLMFEVSARLFEALGHHLEKAVGGVDDPVERLAAGGLAYVRFGRANPEVYRIMFLTRPEATPARMVEVERWSNPPPSFLHLVDMVRVCIDAGQLRPRLTDPFDVALGLWVQFHGLTTILITMPFLPFDDVFLERYVEASLHGIVAD